MKLLRPIRHISFSQLPVPNLEEDLKLQHVGRIISSVPFIAFYDICKKPNPHISVRRHVKNFSKNMETK